MHKLSVTLVKHTILMYLTVLFARLHLEDFLVILTIMEIHKVVVRVHLVDLQMENQKLVGKVFLMVA